MTPQIVENVLQALVAGLLAGAIYGLMCLGLGLIFGVMRVINFAQGDFMMLGMYAAYYLFLSTGIQSVFGNVVGPYVAILLSGPLLFAFGYGIHRFLISRVTGRRTEKLEGEGHFVSIFVNKSRGIAALISIVAMVALAVLITRTRLGKALRASADNPVAATYMGIDIDRSYRIAFGLGAAVTAVAGGLLATNYPFHPYIGTDYVIVMYAGVVLGGMGSIIGAFWGGMTIGLVQQLSTLVLPTQLQNAAIFVVFLLIVFLRPQGFFGRMVERT